MANKMTAPLMLYYEQHDLEFGRNCDIDEESKELLSQLLSKVQKIKSFDKNNERWKFWVSVPRGTFEDYAELRESSDYETQEAFVESWKSWFPKEVYWYEVIIVSVNGNVLILINNSTVLSISPEYQAQWDKRDFSDLLVFLLDEVEKIICGLNAGTYNDYLNSVLPYEYRNGTILRGKLWEINSEEKENYCGSLSAKEIEEFASYDKKLAVEHIKEMTAQLYYDACAICYTAARFEGIEGMTSKQMYLRYADNRDGGLSTIEDCSSEAFKKWFNLSDQDKWEIQNPSHMWQISQGSTHTIICLYVGVDEKGYYLALSGGEHCRTEEIVRMFNALRANGLPVYYHPHEQITKALLGQDEVGIVPCFKRPFLYWYGGFKKSGVVSFIKLDDDEFTEEEIAEIIKSAQWFDISKLELSQEGNG
ncbi:MAG: hypothetical protein OSJ61_07745 [Lachnospiraceae bacterium]|nr:hypothetical protein [Lachnospiraceae bacterium]